MVVHTGLVTTTAGAPLQVQMQPDAWLPPGVPVPKMPLYGSQEPRFWCAPPRHRVKDPGCRACDSGPYYKGGCGEFQSQDLIDWAGDIGYELDPWQEFLLRESCGTMPDGKWAAFENMWIVSRQNGKNQDLEVRELGGLYLFGERMIIHTAHEFKAASEHFRRVQEAVMNNASLSRRLRRVVTSHGEEAIELRPLPTLIFGAEGKLVRRSVAPRLRFLARSRGSGRSFTADCLVYDEAMILTDDQVSASMPTMSAVANPQMYYTASAGYEDSVQLAAVRRRVMAEHATGQPGSARQALSGAEWSINEHKDTCPRDEVKGRRSNRYVICGAHDDRDDPRSWAKANPALGKRIRLEHVAHEFNSMGMTAFDRERLGVGAWPSDEDKWLVVSEGLWKACALPDPGGAVRPIAFAVDVAPDMVTATICAAWELRQNARPLVVQPKEGERYTGEQRLDAARARQASRFVLEIPRHCSREGTDWLIPRLRELCGKHRPVGVAFPSNGPASGFIDEAVRAGIDVLKAGSADEAAAFSLMVTGIRDKAVAHLGKEQAPAMWQAVASAETRDIGDGGRGWSRRDSGTDITPITAATLAYWALNKKRRSYNVLNSVA